MMFIARPLIAASIALASTLAGAQPYPVRPVKLVIPSSPGGGSDVIGRLLAHKLGEQLGQQMIVENRPGASSVIGADFVAKSAPDGYTVLLTPAALSINPSMFAKMPFDVLRDLAPISQLIETGNMLVSHPSLPVRNVKELITLAKTRPGALTVASPGRGGSPHMSAELFKSLAGVDLLIVVYKGSGPGAIALISGEVSLQFATPPTTLPHVRAGRMRALGVTTKTRAAIIPEVPAIGETVPGYEAAQWFGLLAPAGTPRAIIERLHQESVRAVRHPDVKEKLQFEALEVTGTTPDEFARVIRADLDKWAKVIKAAGIKSQ